MGKATTPGSSNLKLRGKPTNKLGFRNGDNPGRMQIKVSTPHEHCWVKEGAVKVCHCGSWVPQ